MAEATKTQACTVAFIGGGNMAQAILAGLLQQGWSQAHIWVVEPVAATRERLQALGVRTLAQAGPDLAQAQVVVWAVKPQMFSEAAASVRPHVAAQALHLSIMAGITLHSLAQRTGSARLVRAMPNTPALVGLGMTGLTAAKGLDATAKGKAEAVLAPTGQLQWFDAESDLDAVTALSGSGPAYVFYFLEALVAAGEQLGLDVDTARRLAVQTFRGASALAAQNTESLATLRERVTSKGGTTHAAILHMQAAAVHEHIRAAALAAHARAQALAREA